MSNKDDLQMEATAAAIKAPCEKSKDDLQMEATAAAIKAPREKSKLEKAREMIGDFSEALEKEEIEKGYDIGFSDDFETKVSLMPIPVVKLTRKATVADALKAEQIAKIHYGEGRTGYEVTGTQLTIARLSVLCTFDGKVWNCDEIGVLGGDFFTHVVVKFSKYLGS